MCVCVCGTFDLLHKAPLNPVPGGGTWSPDTWGNWQLPSNLPTRLPKHLLLTSKHIIYCAVRQGEQEGGLGATSPKVSSMCPAVRMAGAVRIRLPPPPAS